VNGKKIAIPTLSLEEESSGIADKNGSGVTYDTDRLGVPLVEIGTDPTIPDPKSAREVALYIGTLLRITGNVQRGIGSIRQDVNMSIKGGARIEMKGVQELALMDRFIENEIWRQQQLLAIRDELNKRKAKVGAAKELTGLFKGTKVKIIDGAGCVMGFRLEGFKGILGREVNQKRRLGTEISDYAKMAGVNGLIHSDEDLKKYEFSDGEIESVRENLGIGRDDAFIIIAADAYSAKKGIELAIWRARYALEGVPRETRQALGGELCTTRFMRPLPGRARMYPETDVRPIPVTEEMLEEADANAPSIEKEERYLASLVKNAAVSRQLMLSPRFNLFKSIVEKTSADPEFVANFLMQKLTELRRGGHDHDAVSDERMIELFAAYGNGEITKSGVEEIVKALAGRDRPIADIIKELRLRRITGRELEKLVTGEIKTKGKWAVRDIMSKHRLVVDGAELHEIIARSGGGN
jgi:glutamyl-tRNA(Gln) amidotransferase subunit E